jgi:hypothetical protein
MFRLTVRGRVRALFNISNMYVRIPIHELQNILSDVLNQNISNLREKQEYLTLYETINNQNYSVHNGQLYKQK